MHIIQLATVHSLQSLAYPTFPRSYSLVQASLNLFHRFLDMSDLDLSLSLFVTWRTRPNSTMDYTSRLWRYAAFASESALSSSVAQTSDISNDINAQRLRGELLSPAMVYPRQLSDSTVQQCRASLNSNKWLRSVKDLQIIVLNSHRATEGRRVTHPDRHLV